MYKPRFAFTMSRSDVKYYNFLALADRRKAPLLAAKGRLVHEKNREISLPIEAPFSPYPYMYKPPPGGDVQ